MRVQWGWGGAVGFCDLGVGHTPHFYALWPLTPCRGHTPCVVCVGGGDLGVWAMGKQTSRSHEALPLT